MVNHRPQKRQKIRPALQTPMHGPNDIPDPSLGGLGFDESTRRLVVDFYRDHGREGYRDLRATTSHHQQRHCHRHRHCHR